MNVDFSLEAPAIFEMRQCHEYIRHTTGLYLAWFTFFLTTVLAAIAWSFVSALDRDGYIRVPALFFGVVGFFEIQLLLGILGTNAVMGALARQEKRALELLNHFAKQYPASAYQPQSPLQNGIPNAVKVMRATLIVNVVTWFIVAVCMVYAYHEHLQVGGTLSH